MFFRVGFGGSRNGPFKGVVFAFPSRDARLQDGQGQRQPNPDRCGIPAPRHNLAFKFRKVQRLPVPLAGAPPGGISVFTSAPGA
jgi:hypothetical protein